MNKKLIAAICIVIMITTLIPLLVGSAQRSNIIAHDAAFQYTGMPHELDVINLNPARTRITSLEYIPVRGMGGMLDDDGLPYRVGEYIVSLTYESMCDVCNDFICECTEPVIVRINDSVAEPTSEVDHTEGDSDADTATTGGRTRTVPQTGVDRFMTLPVLLLAGALVVTLGIVVLNIIRNKKNGKGSKIFTVLLILSIVSTAGLGVYAVATFGRSLDGVVTARLNITPAPLYLTVVLEDKEFDGTPEIRKESVYLNGNIYNGDDVEVEYSDVALLETADAGESVRIIFDEFTLTGEHDWNYYVYQPEEKGKVIAAGAEIEDTGGGLVWVMEVTPRDIEVVIAPATKIYNRDTDITVASYSFVDVINGFDNIHIGKPAIEDSARLESSNVQNGVDLIFDTDLILLGDDAHNYNLIQPADGSVDILPKPITVTGIVPFDKVYDRTLLATFDGSNMSLVGVIDKDNIKDDVLIGGAPSLRFVTFDAGKSKAMQLYGLSLNGADSANYTFVPPPDILGNISQKPVTANIAIQTREYDRTATASVVEALPFTLSVSDGIITPDNVTVTDWGTVTLNNVNVGSHPATIKGVTLGGADANNYMFEQSPVEGEITRRQLFVTPVLEQKTYDGTTVVELASYGFTGLIDGDVVAISNPETAGETNSTNAGFRDVTFGLTITGPDSGNYVIVQPDIQTITVHRRPVTVDVTYINRYAILNEHRIAFTSSLINTVSGDNVVLTATAPGVLGVINVSDWKHGEYPAIPPQFGLTGLQANNYNIIQPEPDTVEIFPTYGTLSIKGDPWLNETLSYENAFIRVIDHTGEYRTQTFESMVMAAWEHEWKADNELIAGETAPTYTIKGNQGIMNARIGLTLSTECGSITLVQETLTANVPYDIRLVLDDTPVRRLTDNAEIETGFADGGSSGNETNTLFRRQLQGQNVTIHNILSDGNMGGAGTSRTEFRINDNSTIITALTTRGGYTRTYTVNHEDAIDGVVTIHAGYTHRGISVVANLDFGTQICGQTLTERVVEVTNLGNTATGPIDIKVSGHTGAFLVGGGDVGNIATGGKETFNVRPDPANVIVSEHDKDKTSDTPKPLNVSI